MSTFANSVDPLVIIQRVNISKAGQLLATYKMMSPCTLCRNLMHRSRKFCQESNTDICFVFVFFLRGWRQNLNAAKNGPSSVCQQNAIEMVFCWCAVNGPPFECWHGSFVIFWGSGSIFLGNPIFFVIFRRGGGGGGGGGPDPLSPSGSPDESKHCCIKCHAG